MKLTHSSKNSSLFLCALVLSLIGIIFIFTASSVPAEQKFGDMFFFAKRQAVTLFLGSLTAFFVYKIPISYLSRLVLPIFIVCSFLLAATHLPYISKTVNGASRWIRIAGISFQPAELSKLAIILFVAKNLSRSSFSNLDNIKGILSCCAPLVIFSTLLMLQPDFGSTLLLCLVVFAMMFVSGLSLKYILGSIAFGLVGIGAAIWIEPYRMARIVSFLDPWESAKTGGFQIIQSYLGFYNGGLAGLGIGSSRQKLFFLPEAHTDFILSVIGEELGLAGVFIVICLFGFLIYQGLLITRRQNDNFKKLLAFGLTCLIAIQASINMGVSVGLLPTKGMPLPFISHGSSSLLVFLWVVAILAKLNSEADGTNGKNSI